jgi:MOSC domain-containing protein YiiM
MYLVSVNVGEARPIAHAKPSGKTGIFKQPVQGPVAISNLGLDHDAIVDIENHGGFDQAVYLFTEPDYAWWSAHLKMPLAPGTFGENLLLSEMESAAWHIGDRFSIGDVVLEITAPRTPCVTLAARMNDLRFVKRFRDAERPGAYCRVLVPGMVQRGDAVQYLPFTGEQISIGEFFRILHSRELRESDRIRLLQAPIPERVRSELNKF